MEAIFLKFAFFVLIGLAALSLVAIATMVGTAVLKALWSWLLQAHARIAKPGHA